MDESTEKRLERLETTVSLCQSLCEKVSQSQDGWGEWRQYVLKTIDRIESRLDGVEKDIDNLKINSAAWGGVAGVAVMVLKDILSWMFGG